MKKSTWHPLVVSMETEESVGMSRKSRPRLTGFSGDGHGLSVFRRLPPHGVGAGIPDPHAIK